MKFSGNIYFTTEIKLQKTFLYSFLYVTLRFSEKSVKIDYQAFSREILETKVGTISNIF